LNYSSLALFIRRYPLEIEDFAFDLFLGRPALIVVHHDYFKNGYGEIEKFVDRINKLDSSIEWKSIGEIVKKTYLERKAEDGRVDIKMFSNVCEIENHWGRDTLFVVSKKENDGNLVRDVTVNGRAIKHDVEDGNLKFEVQIEEGATYTISINYKDDYPLLFEKQPFGERIKAFSRRRICEMRDNYLWKSELALKGVKKVIHMKQKYFH
jgi:hypothetical protein